jgi:hypothetical protein
MSRMSSTLSKNELYYRIDQAFTRAIKALGAAPKPEVVINRGDADFVIPADLGNDLFIRIQGITMNRTFTLPRFTSPGIIWFADGDGWSNTQGITVNAAAGAVILVGGAAVASVPLASTNGFVPQQLAIAKTDGSVNWWLMASSALVG